MAHLYREGKDNDEALNRKINSNVIMNTRVFKLTRPGKRCPLSKLNHEGKQSTSDLHKALPIQTMQYFTARNPSQFIHSF